MAASIRSSAPSLGTSIFDSIPLCEGKSDDDHRLFLVTNEEKHSEALERLSSCKQTGTLILSNSGMMTLNVFVVREQSEKMNVLLLDCSLRVEQFWLAFKGIILSSKTEGEFLDSLMEHLDERYEDYYHSRTAERSIERAAFHFDAFFKELQSGYSWLAMDKGFSKVQSLFKEGRFFFRRSNWADLATVEKVKEAVLAAGLRVDTLVQGNITEYCEDTSEGVLDSYRKCMDLVSSSTTLIVKTIPRCACNREDLVQEVVLRGLQPIEDVFKASRKCPHISDRYLLSRSTIEAVDLLMNLSMHPLLARVETEE